MMNVGICDNMHTEMIIQTLIKCGTSLLEESTIFNHQEVHQESHFPDSDFLSFSAFVIFKDLFINTEFRNIFGPKSTQSLNLEQGFVFLLKYCPFRSNNILSESHSH